MNRDWPPAARTGLVVAAVTGLAFVLLAGFAVPWEWLPGQRVHAVDAGSVFTPAQIDRNEHISWMFRLASWGNLLVGLLTSWWLGFTRSGGRLLSRLPGPWWVQVVLA
ncbi:MAG: M48 family peptidase, partial [Actinomycetales bacterium]